MYRCTECHSEYQDLPDFCDCGNDSFEEIIEEEYYEEPPRPRRRPAPKKRQLTEEELEELAEEKADRTKALITLGISLLICIVICFMPPHMQTKKAIVQESVKNETVDLPDVNSYWLSDKRANPGLIKQEAKLPILNERFASGSMDVELREFLVNVGKDFNDKWNRGMIEGTGECKAQFTINKDGILGNKSIYIKSRNQTLDDSVLLVLTDLNNVDIPPRSYKGERIIISFTVNDNGTSKVYYPLR